MIDLRKTKKETAKTLQLIRPLEKSQQQNQSVSSDNEYITLANPKVDSVNLNSRTRLRNDRKKVIDNERLRTLTNRVFYENGHPFRIIHHKDVKSLDFGIAFENEFFEKVPLY